MSIIWLTESLTQEVSLIGGKVANLCRLNQQYPVPPGFCLTTQAFDAWYPAIQAGTIPEALVTTLTTAYQQLAEQVKTANPTVAVRSSAVAEDGQSNSFAGQYETYLNIKGSQAVLDAVLGCWRAVSLERVQQYHNHHQLESDYRLAVLIQQLIPADVSGVLFSQNPVTGNPDEIMINSTWGLGESLVGGQVTPDMVVIDKESLTVKNVTIANKQVMTVPIEHGTKQVAVPRVMSKRATLNETQIIELARLGQALEIEMGYPVDVEWAYQHETLYLLQCRPITNL